MDKDYYLHPDIERIREMIHSGELVKAVEDAAGMINYR